MSIAREIRAKEILGEVVAFLDDDPEKIGTRIDGVPVLGPIDAVAEIVETNPGDEALISIPSAGREKLRRLYQLLEEANFAKIRILPAVSQIIEGDAHFIQTRDLNPADLLGRNPVKIGLRESLRYLRGKRVVITGAGGSIGSELARQLLSGGAQRLYLFGHGENSIYEIDRELRLLQEEGVGERASIVPVIGELQDYDYMRFILERLKADVIFHAAAYKHVPMVEANPVVAVKNNVFGTRNLVSAAAEAGVERFVLISTDKVVEPTSVYGVSKRLAEEIVLSADGPERDGAYMVVRFGNVLGSRGSIVPLFQQQIAKGGPVTITDPEVSRYFMTIPEASSLVLKAGGVGEAGSLYVLDMGEPVRIQDLAEQMIRFYGYEPHREIEIRYLGLRRGEKLREHLVGPGEDPCDTPYPRIKRIGRRRTPVEDLPGLIERLRPVCFYDGRQASAFRNRRTLRETLADVFPTLEVNPDEPEY
jgi:FlaA1/EpsC-like NDP-sugar epimerase